MNQFNFNSPQPSSSQRSVHRHQYSAPAKLRLINRYYSEFNENKSEFAAVTKMIQSILWSHKQMKQPMKL
jgi:hypothetical protein